MAEDLKTLVRQKVLSQDSSLLSLPESLLRIRQLATALDGDVYDVEQCVISDPAFAGYLLKLANSALLSAGREHCTSVADAIRRQGIHAVAQLAMVYALQRKHMLQGAPKALQLLLKRNWQRSNSLASDAVSLYQAHRISGDRAARRIDVSDVLLLGTLHYAGSLSALSAASLLPQDQTWSQKQLEELETVALKLNRWLLPEVFAYWGLPETLSHRLLTFRVTDDQPKLRATDYVRNVLLQRTLAASKDQDSFVERNRSELEHLQRLGLAVKGH